MRFIAIILIWITIVGGLAFYIDQRDSKIVPLAQARAVEALTEDQFRIEITPTFGVEADPFALIDDAGADAALTVKLAGIDINSDNRPLERGETLIIDDIQGFIVGNNELFFNAAPPIPESHMSHAMRVRVFRSDILELEKTIWGEAGSRVTGTLHLNLSDDSEAKHDH